MDTWIFQKKLSSLMHASTRAKFINPLFEGLFDFWVLGKIIKP
jgi:hypothetical protein